MANPYGGDVTASRFRNQLQKRESLQKNKEDSYRTRLKAWRKRMKKLGYTTDATNTAYNANGTEVGTFEGGMKKSLRIKNTDKPVVKEKDKPKTENKKTDTSKTENKKTDTPKTEDKKEAPQEKLKVSYRRTKGEGIGKGDTRITKKLKKAGFTETRLAGLREKNAAFQKAKKGGKKAMEAYRKKYPKRG